MAPRVRLTALLVAASCACLVSDRDDPPPRSDIQPGLSLRGGDFATTDDHLVELLVHEGHVYVANSFAEVAAMRLEDDGALVLTDPIDAGPDGERRCTTLAIHPASDTLYCSAEEPTGASTGAVIELYDVSIPGQISWRESFVVEARGVRDLELVDDRLLISQFDDGLWTAEVDQAGALSQLTRTEVEGNVRFGVGVGDRVVLLLADRSGLGAQLRSLDAATFTELGRLALDGPPLGLSADAEGRARVAVALGSGGMAIVDLEGDAPALEDSLLPPAVVTSALISDEIAVAVTLSGAFAWDTSEARPRLFGFAAAGSLGPRRIGNMLHGLIHEGELLTTDWVWVERWAMDPQGESVELDVPRGIYLGPEGPVRWRVRNPGERELRVEVWGEAALISEPIDAGAVVELELSASQRASLLPADEPSIVIGVRAYDPEVPSEGEPLSTAALTLVQREPSDPLPPATGELFPDLTLDDGTGRTYTMPTNRGSQTIWFWPDCALMWPQLEDLAWLERSGRDLGRGEPIALAEDSLGLLDFSRRWGLEGLSLGVWGSASAVGDANGWLETEDVYARFFIAEMPGDAMPTDYVMDAEGRIRSIERMYRGPWTLAVPWPWSVDEAH